MCTIPDIQGLLQPLEEAIHQFFIPALFDRPPCSSMARDLYALQMRLGGLGLVNPCKAAVSSFNASVQLTFPLIALIISQCADQTVHQAQVRQLKQTIRQGNREQQCLVADSLYEQLSPFLQQCVDLAKESGSSSWLTILPVQEHAFHLHKGDF